MIQILKKITNMKLLLGWRWSGAIFIVCWP